MLRLSQSAKRREESWERCWGAHCPGCGGGGGRVKKKAAGDDGKERGYDYVEVMACPGGCVNGGGQLKLRDIDEEGYNRDWEESGVKLRGEDGLQNARWGDREWTKKVGGAYCHDLPR